MKDKIFKFFGVTKTTKITGSVKSLREIGKVLAKMEKGDTLEITFLNRIITFIST